MGSLSLGHWLIVLLIVVLVFGTGKLRNLGKDLRGAIKGFTEGMRSEPEGGSEAPGGRGAESGRLDRLLGSTGRLLAGGGRATGLGGGLRRRYAAGAQRPGVVGGRLGQPSVPDEGPPRALAERSDRGGRAVAGPDGGTGVRPIRQEPVRAPVARESPADLPLDGATATGRAGLPVASDRAAAKIGR